MNMSEIRRIFAQVIRETIESVHKDEYFNPAAELEEMVPELRQRYLDKPGYDELSAVYNLADFWADAVSHGFDGVGCRDYPIDTRTAEDWLLKAAQAFEQDEDLPEPRIVEWYRRCFRSGSLSRDHRKRDQRGGV
jgi:hypothetical protein